MRYAEERSKQAVVAEVVRAVPGLVLVVAANRRACEVLGYFLRSEEIAAVEVNAEKGAKGSREREQALAAFAAGRAPVLVTTDSVLRTVGSELPPVKHVVSCDLPESMQEHSERLQFLGREGHTGRATTIIAPENVGSPVLSELVDSLRASENDLPRWIEGMVKCRRG